MADRGENTIIGRSGRKKRQTGRTYESLKQLIISGELGPGSDLDESDLVHRLRISRTPVREALIRLSAEGLVRMLPNRGAKVSSLDFSDISEHLEIMDILTPSVCYLAALRRTPADLAAIKAQIDRLNAMDRRDLPQRLDAIFRLYTALAEASHNQPLLDVYRLAIYAKLRIGHLSAGRAETQQEWLSHKQELEEVYRHLYRSIEQGDAQAAQSVATTWMRMVRDRRSSFVTASASRNLQVQRPG